MSLGNSGVLKSEGIQPWDRHTSSHFEIADFHAWLGG